MFWNQLLKDHYLLWHVDCDWDVQSYCWMRSNCILKWITQLLLPFVNFLNVTTLYDLWDITGISNCITGYDPIWFWNQLMKYHYPLWPMTCGLCLRHAIGILDVIQLYFEMSFSKITIICDMWPMTSTSNFITGYDAIWFLNELLKDHFPLCPVTYG